MSDKGRYGEIKRRMERDNMVFLAILTLLGALALAVYWLNINRTAFYILVFVIVGFAAIAVLRNLLVPRWARNWSKYVQDERMKRINGRASYQAWALTGLVAAAFMLSSLFKIFDPGTYASMMILLLVMYYSWFFFRWYYGRKGDVE